MATKEEAEYVFNNLIIAKPEAFFNRIDKTKAGVGAVIRILNTANEPLSAGVISEKIGVSTARTAVLLRKMLAKDLIVKLDDQSDGRKTLVRLSEHGKCSANKAKKELFEQLSKVIDYIGMEKMKQFIALSAEIRDIMIKNIPLPPDFDE